jgi:membrane protein DedA with SNARE-associated domain
MDRHGHLAIFYARFLAGVRALVYLTAGSTGVSPRRFMIYDALGALISVPIAVSLGYFFGGQIDLAIGYLGGVERLALAAAAACLLLYIFNLLLKTRTNQHGMT